MLNLLQPGERANPPGCRRYCLVCKRLTAHEKPYCKEHILHMPYAQEKAREQHLWDADAE